VIGSNPLNINDVKSWLLEMVGKVIEVKIIQKAAGEMPQQVVWQGPATVVRCVDAGVVVDLNAGGATWWSRLFGNVGVRNVVPRWLQKPVSIPYCDLSIDINLKTGAKCLVIDAATWKRSPEELTEKKNCGDKSS